jgi:hypothetical protein
MMKGVRRLLVLAATLGMLQNIAAEKACSHGDGCPARSKASDNVLLQMRGQLNTTDVQSQPEKPLTDFSKPVDCLSVYVGLNCDACKGNDVENGAVWKGSNVFETAFGGKACRSKLWDHKTIACGVCGMGACIAGPQYPARNHCPWEWTFGNNGCASCDSWCPRGSVDNMNYGGRGALTGSSCQNNDGKTFPCGNEVAGDNGACHQCKCVSVVDYDRLRL